MIETKYHLHSSKESNYDKADELGLSESAADEFRYTCYEVEITLQVDPKTGKAVATHFQGVALVEPVEV